MLCKKSVILQFLRPQWNYFLPKEQNSKHNKNFLTPGDMHEKKTETCIGVSNFRKKLHDFNNGQSFAA